MFNGVGGFDLVPLKQRIVDLKTEKASLHLIKLITELQGLWCFSDCIDAIRLKTIEEMGPNPPAVENINGEKHPNSTSRTR